MSSSEPDELDDLLADSGSEYDPSSSGDDSDISSQSSSCDQSQGTTDGDRKVVGKKRKKVLNINKTRTKTFLRNRATRRAAGNDMQCSKRSRLNLSSSMTIDYKPFNELMSGVIFSMSGFVNPLRSELRCKAVEMGARYQPVWDSTCTHLICAFTNTPKYQQVKGQGKIVKKEWIENCYLSRKRFPWRRYSLNWRDCRKSESEEEIHELVNIRNYDSSSTMNNLGSTNVTEIKGQSDISSCDVSSTVALLSHEVIDNNINESSEGSVSNYEIEGERNDNVSSSTVVVKLDSSNLNESSKEESGYDKIEEPPPVVSSSRVESSNSSN